MKLWKMSVFRHGIVCFPALRAVLAQTKDADLVPYPALSSVEVMREVSVHQSFKRHDYFQAAR